MTQAERIAQDRRRKAILALLFFQAGQTLTARALRDELESKHGQVVTTDKVKADLAWLADVEFITRVEDVATLTEIGREIVLGRREL